MTKPKTIGQADRLVELRRENETLRERLSRYEAPGPALIQEVHGCHCAGGGCDDGDCDCGAYEMNRVYREQHARCVAVVKRELAKSAAAAQQQPTPYWRGGADAVRNVLTALIG